MISKIFTGHSFAGAVRYVCEEKRRAQVLVADGIRSYDWRKMTDDFVRQAAFHPEKKKACFHGILSFHLEDKIDDNMMANIAQEYLAEIGLANTQFAVVKHTDKAHRHVHLLANLVDYDGKSISDSWIGLRGKKIAQRLTKEYNLTPANQKDLHKTHPEALSQAEANRYAIYLAIRTVLPNCRTLEDLQTALQKQGIQTVLKYKSGTTEKQGISFQLGEDVFKGSKVDRAYSLSRLEKTMDLQRHFNLKKKPETYASDLPQQWQPIREKLNTSSVATGIGDGLSKVIDNLVQPEQGYDPLANEITNSNRKKKKRRKDLY
jgi:hypothetical protein